MIFKVRYALLGGHYHCDLYATKYLNTTYAKCGEFVVREEEFPHLRAAMSGVEFQERE